MNPIDDIIIPTLHGQLTFTTNITIMINCKTKLILTVPLKYLSTTE